MTLFVDVQSALTALGTWAADMVESVKVQKPQVFYLHYPTQGFVASSTTSTMKRRNYQRESKLDEEYGEVEPCIKPMTKRKKNAKRTVKTS